MTSRTCLPRCWPGPSISGHRSKAGPAYAGVVSAEGDYLLIAVTSVKGGELASLPETEKAMMIQQATAQAASAQLRYFTAEPA